VQTGLEDAERAGSPFVFADYACASLALEGDRAAIRAIVERLRALKDRLERFKSDGIQPDDLCAELELKLFAPTSPLLARYGGRGSLEGWLRVLLVRAALDARDDASVHDLVDDMPHLRAPIADPELEAARRHMGEAFREAFYDALAELNKEHRAAIRLHLYEQLTLDETARALGVHRATVARWLASARDELFAATRRLLVERLRVRPEDCESLSRFVLSQVDLSLSRVLAM
jgi:RNA polymerase sigma-70 factor (ECF subfamily)